ncbi:MAG: hypothetical protein E7270_06925 [Lachnospiraceae bacterium]|nr:hypothetical protein [Lachnospiraceae bacterium]
MRKLNKITGFLLAMMVFTSSTIVANAATYDYWISRGEKYIAYVKSTIEWSTNSSKITAVDTDQDVSGIFVQAGGIKKIGSKSTSTKHVYDCETVYLVGAEIKGVTLGYTTSWDDRVTIYRSGSASVDWDD